MRVRILGAAAGGGFPQWNCNCPVCHAARAGRAQPQTQSSIAVRSGDEPWVLINASPDLRQQLEKLPGERPDTLRSTPLAAVVLTDAEIDHTAGLLLLRESSVPLTVYCTDDVRVALTDHYPVLTMLEHYCGVRWQPLVPGAVTPDRRHLPGGRAVRHRRRRPAVRRRRRRAGRHRADDPRARWPERLLRPGAARAR